MNYLTNPIGIDDTEPVLAWQIESPRRGEVQRAYQVRHHILYDVATQTTHPSYGFQVEHGATSLGERRDGPAGSGSQNHFMLGAIDEWFTSGLGGIRQAEHSNAYRELVIRPAVIGDLDEVAAHYRTPYGLVSSEWRRTNNAFVLEVEVPFNSTATVYVPLSANASGQGTVSANGGAKPVRIEDGHAVYEIGSGSWRFGVQNFH